MGGDAPEALGRVISRGLCHVSSLLRLIDDGVFQLLRRFV
jgi:hypothetical protein